MWQAHCSYGAGADVVNLLQWWPLNDLRCHLVVIAEEDVVVIQGTEHSQMWQAHCDLRAEIDSVMFVWETPVNEIQPTQLLWYRQ